MALKKSFFFVLLEATSNLTADCTYQKFKSLKSYAIFPAILSKISCIRRKEIQANK